MILFHAPGDTEAIKNYKMVVEHQLLSEKRKFGANPVLSSDRI